MADSSIRIRCYNVGFGDCLLVTFQDSQSTWNMLIDFGNAPTNRNAVFEAIAEDIKRETQGKLDVVVVTHEHLDHLEGFYSQKKIFNNIDVDFVWMSLPSKPTYYEDYPDAEPLKRLRAAAEDYYRHLQTREISLAPSFEAILLNNLSNADRIDYVRNLPGDPAGVLYLKRGDAPQQPFPRSFKFRILAPEADVSTYYGSGSQHLQQFQRGLYHADSAVDREEERWLFPEVPRDDDGNPPGLSPSDWRKLRSSIQTGAIDSIRAIDKAQNNTSLVMLIEFAGKRLLFPGDAELESWHVMNQNCSRHLKNVDFLKVSHHGSHNGTPTNLLDKILPKSRKKRAQVVVSTMSKVYGTENPVPDEDTLDELKARCRELFTTDGSDELYLDVNL
jgi:beta-lactamase superfamily II metal-dependent hydrolase